MSWVAGMMVVQTTAGPRDVVGWVSGVFMLDFRPYVDVDDGAIGDCWGWCLTHRPTGCAFCGLILDLDGAKRVAEQLAAMPGVADLCPPGSGEGPEPRFFKRWISPIKAGVGVRWVKPECMVPPWAGTPSLLPVVQSVS